MAASNSKKRKLEHAIHSKNSQKKHRKNASLRSSENEKANPPTQNFSSGNPLNLDKKEDSILNASEKEPCDEVESKRIPSVSDSNSDSDSNSSASGTSSTASLHKQNTRIKRKRNDPDVFATSMSKILGSKLTSSKRSDPVLARSVEAQYTRKEVTDSVLELKAKRKIRSDKKEALENGRVKDVLGASSAFDAAITSSTKSAGNSYQETVKEERMLKKTAQRGVVRLFNAVRAAQIKGEEAAREARSKGIVGQKSKEEKINEMSKKGFLDLIAKGGVGLKHESCEVV